MTALDELDSDRDEQGEAPQHLWESREVRWSGLSGVLLLAGYVAQWGGAADGVSIGLWLASLLAGVRFFAAEAIEELVREREVGIELLMTVAAVAAAVLGLWEEAAALAFLYSISEALEEFTTDRTRGAIRALMDLAPKRVRRLVDGVEEEIDLELLAVGDRFVVRPGEGIATDGQIVDGRSALNEAAITGESVPVEKAVGDKVFAGTLNTTGSIVVETTATSVDNTLAKIVHLVTEAQEQKGRGERFMTRFSRRYSPAVLAAGVAIAIVGGIATGEWSTWAERRDRSGCRRAVRARDRDPDHLRRRDRLSKPAGDLDQRRRLSRRTRPGAGARTRQDRDTDSGPPSGGQRCPGFG